MTDDAKKNRPMLNREQAEYDLGFAAVTRRNLRDGLAAEYGLKEADLDAIEANAIKAADKG